MTSESEPGHIYLKLDICGFLHSCYDAKQLSDVYDPHANRDNGKGPLTCSSVGLTSGFV